MDAPRPHSVFSFGKFRFDRRAGGLFRIADDVTRVAVPLGSRGLDLLELLLERHGEVVSQSEIMAAVWSDVVVAAANLAVQVSALRRVLDQNRSDAGWIQTVPGKGYRFVGPVRRLTAETTAASADTSTGDPGPRIAGSSNAALVVGRAAPSRALEASLARASAGDRQVVFVTGEAGIGKTTLLNMALARVSRVDVGVLHGHCTEMFGANEAFLPLIEAVQTACHDTDGPMMSRALRQHAPTWLAQMPGFLTDTDRAAFQTEIFGATRERMLREFCEFLEIISATRPWIVVLEDLHWSDPATLDALSRFARRDREAAVLILATYRPIDAQADDHPISRLHSDLRLHGFCNEIPLDRLSEADVARYLTVRFADAGIAAVLSRRIFHRTQGHPLFVVSLADDLIERGALRTIDGRWHLSDDHSIDQADTPRSAKDMLTRQIERLAVEEQRLLEVASAAGAEFSAAAVAGATGVNVLAVEQSFEALARLDHILKSAGLSLWPNGPSVGRYDFQHALYQQVLYQRLAPGLRIQIHRRLGESLEAGYYPNTAEVAAVLARHFEAGRDFPKAVHYLAQSAESAAKRFATREAVRDFTRALDLVDHLASDDRFATRIRLLRLRGWARRAAGDLAGSMDDMATMISLAAGAGRVDLEATGLMDFSRFSLFADRRQCLPAAERALALSERLDDPELAALVRASSACTKLQLQPWRDDLAVLYQRSVAGLPAVTRDPAMIMRRAAIESTFACLAGDYELCRVESARGKELARRAGDVFLFGLHNIMESYVLVQIGALGEVRRNTAAALAMMERNDNKVASTFCRLTMGWLHAEAMDFTGAIALCETNRDPALSTIPFIYYFHSLVLVKSLLGLGDYPAAWPYLAALVERCRDDDNDGAVDHPYRSEFYFFLAEYWIAIGDLEQARDSAERLLTIASSAGNRNNLALAYFSLARIAMARNDMREASEHVDRAVSMLENATLPLAARRVYLIAAAFHRRVGEPERAASFDSRGEQIVQALAATFDPGDPLRQSLLTGGSAGVGSGMVIA